MFRPVRMVQIHVVVLALDERAALWELGRQGAMELLCMPAGADTAPLAPRDCGAELAHCDRVRARIDELCLSLKTGPCQNVPDAPQETTLDQIEETLSPLEQQTADLLRRHRLLLQCADESQATGEQVSGYVGTGIPLDQADRFAFLHFVVGTLPEGSLAALQKAAGDKVALLSLPPRCGRHPLIAMTTHEGWTALESALWHAGFQYDELPAVPGATTDTLAEEIRRRQEQTAAELERLGADLRALAAKVAPRLTAIRRRVELERRLLEAERNFPRTEHAVLISGWVPADAAPVLKDRIEAIASGRCAIETIAPANVPEEQMPVLLRQPRLLQPFAALVSAYGLPRYGELEPTLFVAISYVLMFGMMFGDVGHGAVLAIAGFLLLYAGRAAVIRDAGVLLLAAAASSMAFGVVYGSYFGLPALKSHALWHDPLEGDPMHLLYAGIGIGIVMISLGLVLNIVNRLRRGDLIGGFLDKYGVVGALFYWGILFLVARHGTLDFCSLRAAAALFLFVPLVGWALKEPLEYARRRRAGHATEAGGWSAAFIESCVGAFEAVLSYFANTISFVRLAAYAMSHAAVLMAAFILATELRRHHTGGRAAAVLVIILGNLAAIVLEGIIGAVQALRLEYYEFFGKFFSGAGRPFRPFVLLLDRPGPVTYAELARSRNVW